MTSIFQPLFTLRKHTASVQTCAFLPPVQHSPSRRFSTSFNSLLLSGDADGVLILWDLELRQPILSFHVAAEAYRQEDIAEGIKNRSNPVEPKTFSDKEPAGSDDGEDTEDEENIKASSAIVEKWRHRRGQSPGIMYTDFLPLHDERDNSNEDASSKLTTLFYTQCRNQCLYIWSIRTPGMEDDSSSSDESDEEEEEQQQSQYSGQNRDCDKFELRLVHTIRVPQHGFCGIPFAMVTPTTVRFPVPHDNCGILSIWDVTFGGETTEMVKAQQTIVDAGDGIKCGQIMAISWRDVSHMAVSFESGHVVLYGSSDDEGSSDLPRGVPAKKMYGMRLFAEPAVACNWDQERVLVSSAEGVVHSYLVDISNHTQTSGSRAQSAPVRVTLVWEAALSRGVGCCQLVGPLAIIGCWDSTVRMYDARYGSIVTVAPFHAGTVNQIVVLQSKEHNPSSESTSIAVQPDPTGVATSSANTTTITSAGAVSKRTPTSSVRKVGTFHFDSRQQRVGIRRSNASAGDDPYVFASVAADGSVAIWKAVLPST